MKCIFGVLAELQIQHVERLTFCRAIYLLLVWTVTTLELEQQLSLVTPYNRHVNTPSLCQELEMKNNVWPNI